MVTRRQVVAELGDAMQRYQRSVQSYDDAVGRALGLGPADLRCLDWLVDGPRTAGVLATATGLRPAATTALIDRLEARGLVERVRDEADRRKVLVRMTDEGMRSTYAMYAPLVEEGQGLFARHSVAQLLEMRDLLDAMREMTDRHRERLTATD
ncbi:MAG TPA: MarR family transcriptional regulator [Ornithinibacter sp.]|nr:MarR family transcriptional regulator [Ornithinibacter sp.]